MEPSHDAAAKRPADDDYDLLTYGEAAARIGELLRDERKRLSELKATHTPDATVIAALELRIAQLAESDRRYRRHASAADKFEAAFGAIPRQRDI
jgi:hypothetical protein